MKNYQGNSLPNILYIADFPPSDLNGGAILLSRLFRDYPPYRIKVFTSSNYMRVSPEAGRLDCEHIVFPATNATGPWGIGRLKLVLNWILLPLLCFFASFYLLRHKSKIIISVAHGQFFIAAAILSVVFRNRPLILFIHDDWVELQLNKFYILKSIYNLIFKLIITKASHVYAISPFMQKRLKMCYKVDSELLFPGHRPLLNQGVKIHKAESLDMVYAGNFVSTVADNLEILKKMLEEKILENTYGINNFETTFFTRVSKQDIEHYNAIPNITFKSWVSQEALIKELQNADILFLPFSFSNNQKRVVGTSLPTKISDYLACGRPILVFAPPYSNLVEYAKEYKFAEIVEEPDLFSLARGIYNIVSSQKYQEELQNNALRTFEMNHNIIKQKLNFVNKLNLL